MTKRSPSPTPIAGPSRIAACSSRVVLQASQRRCNRSPTPTPIAGSSRIAASGSQVVLQTSPRRRNRKGSPPSLRSGVSRRRRSSIYDSYPDHSHRHKNLARLQ
ncbi:unnamed protein product [Sympodiomycopsis kandeliae]